MTNLPSSNLNSSDLKRTPSLTISLESNASKSYLMEFAGIFKDDSDFADIISELQAERQDSSEI